MKDRSDFPKIMRELPFYTYFLNNKNRRVLGTNSRNYMSSLKLLLHKQVQMLQLLLRKGPPTYPGGGWDILLSNCPYHKFVPN